jgi:alpha-acetolactate decarboxylase
MASTSLATRSHATNNNVTGNLIGFECGQHRGDTESSGRHRGFNNASNTVAAHRRRPK